MNRWRAVAVTLVAATAVFAAQGARTERVSFRAGTTSATLKGTITGYQLVDYVLAARTGQTMTVEMKTGNGGAHFNVLPPGSETAIAIGANLGNKWAGPLPANGDYRIRVYLVRAAARRNEMANYTLTVGITGSADARVAGTPYHATGKVGCSVGPDAPGSAQCSFGVIRQGNGRAEVHLANPGYDVSLHKDQVRVLRFSGNTVTSAKASEKVTVEKKADNWNVTVDGFYHYIIPDAVIVGG